eukprot:CAMPEP_0172459162 /NCGR_PEP_ID=MMETSP1065-20121228/31290_1 /TAXON_ID=265537 /ORGANISM="Amphiprora paludosa, Strain CCMP125" /LENGTH=370 /DNA_ID=CAMNT_0013213747 /DNA_START=2092 /DNA_END=3204 /DNA_ORIENTATION=+
MSRKTPTGGDSSGSKQRSTPILSEGQQKMVEEWNARVRLGTTCYEDDIPLAPVTVPTGPDPYLSKYAIAFLRLCHLRKLKTLVRKINDPPKMMQLMLDLQTLHEGKASTWAEEKACVRHLLRSKNMIKDHDHEILELVLLLVDDRASLQRALDPSTEILSVQTSQLVAERLDFYRTNFDADTSEISERAVVAMVDALPIDLQKKWLEMDAYLLFAQKRDNFAIRRGESMNQPKEASIETGVALFLDKNGQLNHPIRKSSIVGLVAVDEFGFACSLGKRITGIPGDVVKDRVGNFWKVPPDHFWAEGDNRRGSYDSRDFGPVPISNLRFWYDRSKNAGEQSSMPLLETTEKSSSWSIFQHIQVFVSSSLPW